MKNSRKILSAVLIAAAAICLIAAIALTAQRFTDTMQTRNTMDELRTSTEPLPPESSSKPEESPSPSPVPESTPEPVETPTPTPSPVVNPYLDSFLANDDMAAWLQIPGTDIDYPVMWTPRDEEYYLRRGFDGARNQNGCLILDTDSCLDPLTTNLIIHGHNMRSGTMFGTLEDYEDEAYCQEHNRIILYTEDCQRNYEVVAVFRSQVFKKSDTVFKFYKFFQADTQEEFDDFYENIKALSLYDTGVTAEFGDCFITLTTCSNHVEQGRFVVVAKEVESGDTYLPLEEVE
ncbi:MAG: class B sortase [Acetatifactor sp.]|nr:class B sortase [Acetatifactor sp.]